MVGGGGGAIFEILRYTDKRRQMFSRFHHNCNHYPQSSLLVLICCNEGKFPFIPHFVARTKVNNPYYYRIREARNSSSGIGGWIFSNQYFA